MADRHLSSQPERVSSHQAIFILSPFDQATEIAGSNALFYIHIQRNRQTCYLSGVKECPYTYADCAPKNGRYAKQKEPTAFFLSRWMETMLHIATAVSQQGMEIGNNCGEQEANEMIAVDEVSKYFSKCTTEQYTSFV